MGIQTGNGGPATLRYNSAVRKPRLKFAPMLIIQLVVWAVYLAMSHYNETFAAIGLAPCLIVTVALAEWASGREVIRGWDKDRT